MSMTWQDVSGTAKPYRVDGLEGAQPHAIHGGLVGHTTHPAPAPAAAAPAAAAPTSSASAQGLTLVHFSAQRKRYVWDRVCMLGLLRGCLLGVRGHWGASRVCFVPETAQVELKIG